MLSRENLLKIFTNTALGLILIFFWFRLVNLGAIGGFLKSFNPLYLIFMVVFFCLSTLFRSIRLKIFLKDWDFSLKNLVLLNFLSQFLSFAIPIRAGEIAKGIYLTKKDFSFTKSVLLIFLDRLFDFWINLVLVSALLYLIPNNLPKQTEIILILLILGFLLAAFLAVKMKKIFLKLVNFFSVVLIFNSLKKAFSSFANQLMEGFENLKRPFPEILQLLFLSILAAVSDSLIWLMIFISLGANLGFLKTLLGSLLDTLTFLVPAAPGYVGSIEAGTLAVFSGVLSLNSNLSSSAAVILHLFSIIFLPLFGFTALYLLKFNLKLLFNKLNRRKV